MTLYELKQQLEKLGFKVSFDTEKFENNPELNYPFLRCYIEMENPVSKGYKEAEAVAFYVKENVHMDSLVFYKNVKDFDGVTEQLRKEISNSTFTSIVDTRFLLQSVTNDFYNWQCGNDGSSKFRIKKDFWNLYGETEKHDNSEGSNL